MKVKMAVWGVLTSVGQSNCEPPVPCAFNSRCFLCLLRLLSPAIGRFGVSAALLRSGAVRVADGYTASPHD